MPIRYTAGDALAGGMPVGGLGCGVMQIFPDGSRGGFTGLNNWEQPLTTLHRFRRGDAEEYRDANPLGIYAEWNGQRVAKLLQRTPLAKCPVVQDLVMEADFPVAELTVLDAELPVEVRVRHWSPFVPHDSKASGLPVMISSVHVANPTAHPMTVSVLACCVNAVGAWNVGRVNRLRRANGLVGVECRRRHSHARDERAGTMVLATDASTTVPGAEVTFFASWMYATHPFRGNRDDRRLAAWEAFAAEGRLPNRLEAQEAMGELDEPMGALAVRVTLAAFASRDIPFYSSWFMPNHLYGHQYARWFRSAWDVAAYVSPRRRRLYAATRAWQQTVRASGLPEWLADGLINSLGVYTAASWWTRDGRFALYENPVKWPLMDSLDVRYYGTLPLAMWFPELEQSTLLQFAALQRADGRIPHDLGKAQLDCPSDGTTAGAPWKDLATKFTLMAYRDVAWGGGTALLRRLYPHVKRAMLWEFGTDRNGDGLPDNEGCDSTYDLWPFYGTSAYTAIIFLAALRAAERLATLYGDRAFARVCREWDRRGSARVEQQLWTGEYYRAAARADGTTYEACIAGQLNGQWYAHLLGLGSLLLPSHVRSAVQAMLRLNGQGSRFGAINAVFSDGTVDTSSWHSGNIWVGETYALASLAIYEGFIEEGLELTRRMWMTFVEQAKSPWSQPDVVAAEDGRLGDGEWYLRNVAIWSVPCALARTDGRVRQMFKTLAPSLHLRRMREVVRSPRARAEAVLGSVR